MLDSSLLKRITSNPQVFGGKPIVRSMRISVELVLGQLAQGVAIKDLLEDYPGLEAEDVLACLAYAHAVIANDSLDNIRVG